MSDTPKKTERMEALRFHTLYGAQHAKPYQPGDFYELEAPYVETVIAQGMARRALPKPAGRKAEHDKPQPHDKPEATHTTAVEAMHTTAIETTHHAAAVPIAPNKK